MDSEKTNANLREIELHLADAKYTLGDKLNMTKNSWVYTVIKDNQTYVAKIIFNTIRNRDVYITEITNQYKCDKHPNIAKIYETFTNIDYSYIILEYYPKGSLRDIEEKMSWDSLKFYYSQVVKGLIYVHEQHIIHRDIKVNNILICNTKDGEIVKIIDFGLSCKDDDKEQLNACVGTPFYVAPEVSNTQNNKNIYYNNKVDIWSLGVSIYYSHTRKYPFRVGKHSKSYVFYYNDDYMTHIDEENIELLLGKIFRNAEERISLREILIFFEEN